MALDEADALLAWNALTGLGPGRLSRLLRAAGSARAAAAHPGRWWASASCSGPPPSAQALADLAARQRAGAERAGATLLSPWLPGFPACLAPPVPGFLAPPALLLRGSPAALARNRERIGVVGARACTPYGRAQAERFGEAIAWAGAAVVSGAARGIDQAAMRAALRAGGPVVAVLGSPLDRVYPVEAAALLEEIVVGGGAVLSEFPFQGATLPGNFPRRNRLIAAAADALLVVQATRRSGTMSTCRHALDLGRTVYALPGPVDCPVSEGTHQLLREGAALAEHPRDLLHAHRGTLPEEARGEEPAVLAALAGGAATLGVLAERLGRPERELALELTEHELRGQVRRGDGGTYHRSGPQPCVTPPSPAAAPAARAPTSSSDSWSSAARRPCG